MASMLLLAITLIGLACLFPNHGFALSYHVQIMSPLHEHVDTSLRLLDSLHLQPLQHIFQFNFLFKILADFHRYRFLIVQILNGVVDDDGVESRLQVG